MIVQNFTRGTHICMESVACDVLAGSVPTRGYILLVLICWSETVLPVSASASVLVLESSTPLMFEPPSPSAVTSEGPVFFNSPSLPNVPSIASKLETQAVCFVCKNYAGWSKRQDAAMSSRVATLLPRLLILS